MNALLAEIERKKSALAPLNADAGPSSGPKKYMRRAEVEAAQAAAEQARKDAAREAAREMLRLEKEERAAKKAGGGKSVGAVKSAAVSRITGSPVPGATAAGMPDPDASGKAEKDYQMAPAELDRRLRARGHPIRLFGESDKDRRARLRQIEISGDDRTTGVKADAFWQTLKDVEAGQLEKDAERAGAKKRKMAEEAEGAEESSGKGPKKTGDGFVDMEVVKDDIKKAYAPVYWAFKNLYQEWGEWMDNRPEDVKRSTAGKLALATHVQSGVNMKPLYKQLRGKDMPPDLIYKLAELVHHVQERQYQRANDAYLRLSIGNAAWPIGVTSVGLHERGAREKITEDVVAHVLNDEVSRKWIQAVKRLVTFSQMVRPPADAAHSMG